MSNMASAARDTMNEAKEAAKETRKAASAASGDIQSDLAALRDDVTKLTDQISDILANRGNAAWRKARSNVEGVISDAISDAEAKGMEAVDAVREVGDNIVDAVDESLKRRPYTTLALALGVGFLFGATWRR
jgi:ElaB/YqjD/DUF883 family membrane-anchored ribosome-binding protein